MPAVSFSWMRTYLLVQSVEYVYVKSNTIAHNIIVSCSEWGIPGLG